MVVSWKDVRYGAADIRDGSNVVLHEFAHQLDLYDSVGDGAPKLPRRSMYVSWARVMSESYKQLQNSILRDHKHVMNSYGATNPAEFFAVATEAFFEKPSALKTKHRELYDQLALFYQQSPETYVPSTPLKVGFKD